MTRVAFFGHDANDAAIRRRVSAFQGAGIDVARFMMCRRGLADQSQFDVYLAHTFDAEYVQRARAILVGATRAAKSGALLRSADLIYARKPGHVGLRAFMARARLGLTTPIIYECLDVHRVLTRSDLVGAGLRRLEHALLSRTALLTISSPAFEKQYFEKYHPGLYRSMLIENRLTVGDAFGVRPAAPLCRPPGSPLRIGWFGNLRCLRSIELLNSVASAMGDRVQIILWGYFTKEAEAAARSSLLPRENVVFHGRYQAPQDLAKIYSDIDVVWAGDYFEAGYNSSWLLPNQNSTRGGYFATPAIAAAGTQTETWIAERGAGFLIDEPVEIALPTLVERLADNPRLIVDAANRLPWPSP